MSGWKVEAEYDNIVVTLGGVVEGRERRTRGGELLSKEDILFATANYTQNLMNELEAVEKVRPTTSPSPVCMLLLVLSRNLWTMFFL